MMTPEQAMKAAIQSAGSRYRLSKLIDRTSQAVYQWNDRVPAECVLSVEAATGISRHDLRPDLYPREASK